MPSQDKKKHVSVWSVLQARRAIYTTRLTNSNLMLDQSIAKTFWKRECDLFDLAANQILGRDARPVRDQVTLRSLFCDSCTSAAEIVDATLARAELQAVDILSDWMENGVIPPNGEILPMLAHDLEMTRLLASVSLLKGETLGTVVYATPDELAIINQIQTPKVRA